MQKGIILSLTIFCLSANLSAQTPELDSLIKEQVQLYISNYPQDNYSLRAKRIMNVLNSHDEKINMIEVSDYAKKSKELESIKHAMLYINEKVRNGTSLEKAKVMYQRQTQHKSKPNTDEAQDDQPAFSVPESTKE